MGSETTDYLRRRSRLFYTSPPVHPTAGADRGPRTEEWEKHLTAGVFLPTGQVLHNL